MASMVQRPSPPRMQQVVVQYVTDSIYFEAQHSWANTVGAGPVVTEGRLRERNE